MITKGTIVPKCPHQWGQIHPTTSNTVRRPGDEVIARALRRLAGRLRRPGAALRGSRDVRAWLTLNHAELDHERFILIWLDSAHRVIAAEPMFRGTIHETAVHVREVVKAALRHNAAAAIIAHNHPSGVAEPSHADEMLTRRLKDAMEIVDCRLLDHMVIGGAEIVSFSDRGLMDPPPLTETPPRRRRRKVKR